MAWSMVKGTSATRLAAHLLARIWRGAGMGHVPASSTRHVRDVWSAAPQIARVVVLRGTRGGGLDKAGSHGQVHHGLNPRTADVRATEKALPPVPHRAAGSA